ncbi:hypothetical protein Ahy_B10g104071 [Arachis hypogaea]|uniref:Zinc finger PMZ-type domain-containing protein n=1 Tax=Arachis hypogaea TaxID=3818 RepID=A0A444X4M6_ARAHY|nr:hypothetical protein Ahy_B10g104071 [Arachis hypogaea]
MEGTANLVVYRNGEIIQNTHEGVRFVCQNLFSFVVLCTMTLMEFQNGLCQSIENGMLMRVSRILYRNPVVVFGGLIQFDIMLITDEASMQNMFLIHRQTQMRHPQIELYVEFENVEAEGIQNDLDTVDDRSTMYEGINSDSEEDFEATYEAGDEDENGDVGVEAAAENVVIHPSSSQPMNVPPFIHDLDLDSMHAPEFSEYANIGVANPEDGEFRIGMEYSSRKSVVATIRSYTISRGVDYNVKVGVGMISDRHESIRAAVNRSGGDCQPPRAWWMFCIRHIGRNFLRAFKVLHLQKLVANIGYSRTVEEYNINYKRLEEQSEAYARWCDAIGLRHWVLAFDEGHRWGHMRRTLSSALTHSETHERKRAGFTYSVFAQQRIEANMQQAGNIVVHRFDRRNEEFEVHEMTSGKVLVVDLARQTCDYGHFQVERLPCHHVIVCCANQRLDWQLYVHNVYKMIKVRKVIYTLECPLLVAGDVVHTQTDALLGSQGAIRYIRTITMEQRCHTPQDVHVTHRV